MEETRRDGSSGTLLKGIKIARFSSSAGQDSSPFPIVEPSKWVKADWYLGTKGGPHPMASQAGQVGKAG